VGRKPVNRASSLTSARAPRHRRYLLLFVFAVACLGAAGGIFESTFNNYLDDTFHITAAQRGNLELPRELPGFLVTLVSGALFFLGETHLAVLAAGLTALGLAGLGLVSSTYSHMLFWMVLWSTGMHLMMPTQESIALGLAREDRRGEMLGRLGAATSLAMVVGCGSVWLNFAVLGRSFGTTFCLGASAAALACVLLSRMRGHEINVSQRPKLILRRRYWLFYLLSILFGARKQIFITFGIWVLIRVYHQPTQTIALLWIITTTASVFFRPLLGRLIDRVGERAVLMANGAALFFVCLGYGFAEFLGPKSLVVYIVFACFILDQMLFAVGMARSTYLSRIALSKTDVGASLRAGVSINHAVSIPIAMIGGRIWQAFDYHVLFAGAAALALVIALTSSLIRVPRTPAPTPIPEEELASETEALTD